jgi:hypothetical protein
MHWRVDSPTSLRSLTLSPASRKEGEKVLPNRPEKSLQKVTLLLLFLT